MADDEILDNKYSNLLLMIEISMLFATEIDIFFSKLLKKY